MPTNTLTNVIPVVTGMVARALMPYLAALRRFDDSFNPTREFASDEIRVPKPDQTMAARQVTPGVTAVDSVAVQPTRTVLSFTRSNWIEVPFTLDDFELTNVQTNYRMRQAEQAAYELMLEIERRTMDIAIQGAARAVSAFDVVTTGGVSATTPLFDKEATARPLPLEALTRASDYLTTGRAPLGMRSLILDTPSYHRLAAIPEFNQSELSAPLSAEVQMSGLVTRKLGWDIFQSQGIRGIPTLSNVAGTRQTSAAEPVGETVIAQDGGSGIFRPGEAIGFGTNPRRTYVVAGSPAPTAASVTLNAGLLEAVADNTAIKTVNGSAPRGIAMQREFMLFACKYLPDATSERQIAVPNSMTAEVGPCRFRVLADRQSDQWQWKIQCAFAAAVHRPNFGVQLVLS